MKENGELTREDIMTVHQRNSAKGKWIDNALKKRKFSPAWTG